MKFLFEPKTFVLRVLVLCALLFSTALPAYCQESASDSESFRVIIFVSKNIRPYIEAVDGMRENIDGSVNAEIEVVLLDRYDGKAKNELVNRLTRKADIDMLVAVGPEAASFVWETFQSDIFLKIYSIILNPEKVIGDPKNSHGISLNIPPDIQLKTITQGFPALKRVGIFYDPAHNSEFYESAAIAAFELDIELVPLTVTSRKDIPFLLTQCWDSIDSVWLIPDRTVISESIAQYIIKQSILKKVPVIGYNQFFYQSGAAMAFIFDYKDLGRQTARLIKDVLLQKEIHAEPPVFKVWLNGTVLHKLNIETSETLEIPMVIGQ